MEPPTESKLDTVIALLQAQMTGKAAGNSGAASDDKKDTKYTTLYETVVPNGATQFTFAMVKRENTKTNESNVFITLEHFLRYSKEGPKVLFRTNLPAKKDVLEAMIHALGELHKRL